MRSLSGKKKKGAPDDKSYINVISLKSVDIKNTIFFFVGLLLITGCDLIKVKKNNDSTPIVNINPIARVHDVYLYPDDLKGIVPQGASKADSAAIISRYVSAWVKKQLLITEASNNIDFDQAELERKILDYRYALMVYEFEKHYINQTLNMTVSDEEVEQYYNENIKNFELKQNIIKGIYIQVPKEAPRVEKVKKLITSDKEEDKKELKSYCYRFATTYSLEDTLWINFDELIQNTPLISIPNKVEFLKKNNYIETADDAFHYFLKIKEYKISDQTSPLEFVKDEIANIIINKRKIILANQLEKDIYERAVKNKDFKIFNYD